MFPVYYLIETYNMNFVLTDLPPFLFVVVF